MTPRLRALRFGGRLPFRVDETRIVQTLATGLELGFRVAMLARLLFLFITAPLVELALLLLLGEYIGLRYTILLVITTGIAGAWLARRQGWRTYQRIQRDFAAGKMPTDSLVDAAMIFVAGALLLTPGVLTDAFGLSLLIPRCRRFYQQRMTLWFRGHVNVRTYSPDSPPRHDKVIDSYVVDREDGSE